jgi:hypothetical protein
LLEAITLVPAGRQFNQTSNISFIVTNESDLLLLLLLLLLLPGPSGWQFNQATNRATRVSTESGFVAYTLPYANPNPNTAGDRIIQQ